METTHMYNETNIITLELTDQEYEMLRAATNSLCADYISNSVDLTVSQDEKDAWTRLYDKANVLRDKVYAPLSA